ncbi:hypothetical protein GCM10010123_10440 [Pilimelia anulata]|uniref:Uncharacterized protein n=1 Tax=Pilimelia anulata TaxID=53371 RepID=A0A8J3B0W8_9ACTN|nr:hypothetical protein [Pilimelia anulata]GGJ82709.1 hypothetical protein GCM10010123_10440 [Pilimelia anulata]
MLRAYGRHLHDTWRGVWAMLFFGAFGLLIIFGSTPQNMADPVRMSQIASVALSDDDSGHAMFDVTRLRPGHQVSRCIAVRYDGLPGGSEVRLVAQNINDTTPGGATLADHIRVQVSRGTVGSSASCTGFDGAAIYAGSRSLSDLGVAGGVGTGWTPVPNQTRVFRITIWLRSDAPQNLQGKKFNADLIWGMTTVGSAPPAPPTAAPTTTPPPVPTDPPVTTPPTDDEDAPGVVPTTEPSPTGTPQPDVKPSRSTPGDSLPTLTPTAAPPAVPDNGGGDGNNGGQPRNGDGGGGGDTARGPIGNAVKGISNAVGKATEGLTAFTKAAGKAAAAAAKRPQYPFVSIGIMFLFLLAQDRFDRRDPKLALAPVMREPYLIFAESAEAADRTGDYIRFDEPKGG